MRSQRLVPLGLALIGLVLLGLYAASPVTATRGAVEWSPTDPAAPTTQLNLAAQRPESLRVSVPCEKAAAAQGRVFSTDSPGAFSQGLELHAQAGSAWASLNGRVIAESVSALDAGPESGPETGPGCLLVLEYDRARDAISLSTPGGSSPDIPLRPLASTGADRAGIVWQVNALTASPAVIPGLRAEVLTQPAALASPAWRWALSIGSILAALGALLTLARSISPGSTGGPSTGGPSTGGPSTGRPEAASPPLWNRSDTAVSLVALMALVVVPPTFDDGWVLTTVRQYDELGFFSNYFSNEATPQPLGFWWTWLEHWWLSPLWTPGFLLRLPAALIVVAGWWLLRRRVLEPVLTEDMESSAARAWGRRAGCLIYLCVAVSFLFTLRPEPLIALLVIAAIAVVVSYERSDDPRLVVLLGALAALALSAHQTGWCVAGAALATAPRAVRWMRGAGRGRALIAAATVVASSATLFIALSMLGMNASTWRRAIGAFSDDTITYSMAFREDKRLDLLVNSNATGAGRIFAVALIATLVLGFISRSNRSLSLATCAGHAALGAMAGLLLTSSKVPDHVGVVAGPLAVLACIVAADLRAGGWGPRGVLLTLGLALGAWVATNPLLTGARNTDLVSGHANLSAETPLRFLPVSSPLFWVVLLGFAGFLGWRFGVRPGTPGLSALAAMSAAVVAAVPVLGLLPGLKQAGDQASWVGQAIGSVTGRSCGLAGTGGAAVPVRWSALQPVRPSTDSVELLDSPAQPTATPRFGPVTDTRVYAVPFGSSGFAATPWFPISAGAKLGAWAQSGGLPVSYSLDYADAAGAALGSQPVRRTAELGVWQSVQVEPPAGASQMRISWFSSEGPLAVSSPVVVAESQTLREAAGSGPVWVNPNTYLEAPCLIAPSIAAGTYEAFEWSLGPPTWNGSRPSEDVTQMACPTSNPDRHLRCAYAVRATPFSGTTTTAGTPEITMTKDTVAGLG